MKSFRPYSYSKVSTYVECPRKFKFQYVDGIRTPFMDNHVFEKGRYFHAALENHPTRLVPEFKYKENEARRDELVSQVAAILSSEKVLRLLDSCIRREYRFFLDSGLRYASKKSKDIFFKGIIDFIGQTEPGSIDIVDWKSGKTKSGSLDQLRFYSIWAFEAFKNIDAIRLSLFYLEDDQEKTETVTRDDHAEIKENFLETVGRIESDVEYKKKTNKGCEYCPFFQLCGPFKIEGYGTVPVDR